MIDTTGNATEHFKWEKLKCKGSAKIGCCSGLPESEDEIKQLLNFAKTMEAFRWFVSVCCAREVYLIENSIYRCDIWNKDQKGAPKSTHKYSKAGDMDPRYKSTRRRVPIDKFSGMAVAFGFTGIIGHKTFAHLDVREDFVYILNARIPYRMPKEFPRFILDHNHTIGG